MSFTAKQTPSPSPSPASVSNGSYEPMNHSQTSTSAAALPSYVFLLLTQPVNRLFDLQRVSSKMHRRVDVATIAGGRGQAELEKKNRKQN